MTPQKEYCYSSISFIVTDCAIIVSTPLQCFRLSPDLEHVRQGITKGMITNFDQLFNQTNGQASLVHYRRDWLTKGEPIV